MKNITKISLLLCLLLLLIGCEERENLKEKQTNSTKSSELKSNLDTFLKTTIKEGKDGRVDKFMKREKQ